MSENVVGTFSKHHDEVLKRNVDFSAWLDTGDTVSTHVVSCFEGDDDLTSSMIGATTDDNDDTVTFFVQGGEAGKTFTIEVKATTAGGESPVAVLYMNVV